MRTVTFSSPQVQNLLNKNFVNTFTNIQGDPTAGQSIDHPPTDPAGSCIRGNGKQNVQTIFMTPAGEIFHVGTGFLSSEDLVDEIDFALRLYREIKSVREPDAQSVVVERHRERLRQQGFGEQDINAQSGLAPMMRMAGGSGSRNSSPGSNIFQSMIERQFLEDNQFSIKNPLLTGSQLERDPARLVGNGQSFFSSQSSRN